MVSAFALCVSVIATGISVWQTFLIQEQVNASDRNRSYESIITKTETLCTALAQGAPARARASFSGDSSKMVLAFDRDALDPQIFTSDFRKPLNAAFRDLDTTLITTRLWVSGPQKDTYDETVQWLRHLFYSFDGDFRADTEYYRDLFTSGYALADYACNNYATDTTVRSFLASWLLTGSLPPEANWLGQSDGKGILPVLLTKEELSNLSDEEVIAKAIEQAKMSPPDTEEDVIIIIPQE
ncbi:hypothetical protein SAMN05880593_12984 [Rhizobium sp. RU36D]|nr:hypothetical protein SAMN05880593_12984 [Rhizobium sp. RU36D]